MRTPAHRENLLTLAHALSIDEPQASMLLDARITITHSPLSCDRACAALTTKLLRRTFAHVGEQVPSSVVEVVIGDTPRRTSAPATIFVQLSGSRATVGHEPLEPRASSDVPQVLALVVACYVAAAATRSIGGPGIAAARYPIVIDLADLLGDDLGLLGRRVDFGEAYLAGAGAIGNAFVLGLSTLDVSGTLHIADDDLVSEGNLNRCFFFEEDDVESPKAEVLATRVTLPHVQVIPHTVRLQKVPGSDRIEQLVVGVDSPRARRHLQEQLPRKVFDASTTGIAEVVLHFNDITRREKACLSCVYHAQPREHAHEQHIADALGVTLADVHTQYVSARAAETIRTKYPGVSKIEGLAYDTLFKEICGQQLLRSSQGADVLAPFGFVSALAGALLALEFVRRTARGDVVAPFNYWRVSPWTSPVLALRQTNPPNPQCTFCNEPVLVGAAMELWRDS